VPLTISRSFKDISTSFTRHPITGDLSVIKNETAVSRSVRNIVSTQFGERPFEPTFGSDVAGMLFENVGPAAASMMSQRIRDTVEQYEPRVNVTSVDVAANVDSNAFDVTIVYDIVGLAVGRQHVTFVLESAN